MSTKVTIKLRPHVAERLRKMCHARGLTASDLIDKWIFEHDDAGQPLARPKSATEKLAGHARLAGAGAAMSRAAIYLSAAVRVRARDQRTGKEVGAVLEHVALSKCPLLKRRRVPIDRRRKWQQVAVAGRYNDVEIGTAELLDVWRNWSANKREVAVFDTHQDATELRANAIVGVLRDLRVDGDVLEGRVEWVR